MADSRLLSDQGARDQAAAIYKALVTDRIDQAKRNTELGWCPCGEEANGDCECFGVYRLSCVQGLVPVRARSDAFDQKERS